MPLIPEKAEHSMNEKRKQSGPRLLRSVLLLIALLIAAVSCGKANDDGPTSDSGTVTNESNDVTEEQTGKYDVPDTVGNRDYENAVIRIASTNRSWYDDEVVVARATGDIIDDAVFRRNKLVDVGGCTEDLDDLLSRLCK